MTKEVVTAKASDSAASVLRLVDSKGLSGVAIVDADGKLVSNLSASDLRVRGWFLQTG